MCGTVRHAQDMHHDADDSDYNTCCIHCRTGGQGGFRVRTMSAGGNFVWGRFRHTSRFGAGPSDAGGTSTPPPPGVLLDNQLCETLVGPNSEQQQLIRDIKIQKEQSPGRLSIPKEALAPRRMHTEQEVPPNCGERFHGKTFVFQFGVKIFPTQIFCAIWGSSGSLCILSKFREKNFDAKLKNEIFPTNLSPYETPPPCVYYSDHNVQSICHRVHRAFQ